MENARVGARASSRTGERRLALMLALMAAISSGENNGDARAKNQRIVGNLEFIASLWGGSHNHPLWRCRGRKLHS